METGPNTCATRVTQLLTAAGRDASVAANELFALVYDELRGLAARRVAEFPGDTTITPTALVHEVYLRLVGHAQVEWGDRVHFFAAAAQAMRRILVERARLRGRLRRGAGWKRVSLDEATTPDPARDDGPDMIGLDHALTGLAAEDARKSQIVVLRYFAGLTVEETARALNVSEATVKRDWAYAKAWLYDAMAHSEESAHAADDAIGPRE